MYKKETKVAIILDNLNGVAYHRLMVPIAKMSRDYGIEVTCLMSRDDAFMDAIKKIETLLTLYSIEIYQG